jgi:hypothetical protein
MGGLKSFLEAWGVFLKLPLGRQQYTGEVMGVLKALMRPGVCS